MIEPNMPPAPIAPVQLHLIADVAFAAAAGDVRSGTPHSLAVTADSAFLLVPVDSAPRFLAVPPESFADVLVVEPLLSSSGHLRLVVVNPAAGHLRVNGQPVPRVALLREKDEFNLNFGPSLFVTTWRQPHIGPPDAARLHKPCPICRVPLVPDTRVYHCQCGCGLHCERPEDKAEPLQCASLSEFCVRCNSPIIRESGFSWLPEFSHA
jgi:hypothetical protein